MSSLPVRAEGFGLRLPGAPGPVLAGLDLDLAPGEVVLLAGPSGVGKSTLLHALAGLLGDDAVMADVVALTSGGEAGGAPAGSEPGAASADAGAGEPLAGAAYSGQLWVGETAVFPTPPGGLAGRVGLVQQDPETQIVMSRIGDDVAFGAENLGVEPSQIWERVRSALAAVGLGEFPLNHPTAALSGGQKQRLAVAGLLAMRPGLWLLDEPTANLDPEGAAEVRDVVLGAAREAGATVLIVEHRLGLWAAGADRLVVLNSAGPGLGAKVVAQGSPSGVLADPEVSAVLADAGLWLPGHRPALSEWSAPAPGEELLRAESLGATRVRVPRSARGKAKLEPVVSGVDLSLRAGQALALVGPNGAGKSSLALTLAGLQPPLRGAVLASPALATGAKRAEPSRFSARELVSRIGMVFQDPEHQFVARSVRAELEFGPRRAGVDEAETKARVDELLERLGLAHLADVNPYQLSGGQQRRLSVGTALATRPRVLVLDEPTFGQDARTWVELVELLRQELDRGTAVVAVTHDGAFVRALGATVVRVEAGQARMLSGAAIRPGSHTAAARDGAGNEGERPASGTEQNEEAAA